jgi:hypothetical protein
MKSQQERVMNYLEGEMDPSERSQFEADLQRDASLRQEFEQMSQIAQGMKSWGIEEAARRAATAYFQEKGMEAEQPEELSPEIRGGVAALGRERLLEKAKVAETTYLKEKAMKRAKIVRMRRVQWVLAAAASVVLLVGAWWLLVEPKNDFSSKYAYYSSKEFYSRHIDLIPSTQGFSDDMLNKGIRQFNKGYYGLAIDTLLLEKSDTLEAALFIGLSLLKKDEADIGLAVEYFDKAQRSEPGLVKSYAQWNLALCSLRLGQNENAKAYLEALKNPASLLKSENPALYEEVEKLLKELH